ncbi:dephospho-CoA kinase [Olleya aquimaris]|uniref:Dephospho-CoA kinase n=1 Tax=Olleya sediminilitoris TaxID=2795739 RepID=A0ABS1WLG0_9FLAO|nr:dephospho-CoA kinase [Olleya sediminilitoris]AXO78862.1 dephospho-CoA kinase [Olleya aquimaris]MBL7559941.1 dephospho-CoA kinase [Olleya sediminilitoris]
MTPKIIGLTGGIGSGKTTVANFFKKLGVPIYIADTEAKALMNRSKIIKRKLIKLFGEQAYIDDKLNKPFIASQIFSNQDLLQQMNAIVHPKVAKHFANWVKKQSTAYVISEAAILFENGSYKKYDYIITVVAPKEVRLKRVLKRDSSSKEKVEAIMNNQWSDNQKIELSDFVINNTNLETTKLEVGKVHKKILKRITNP